MDIHNFNLDVQGASLVKSESRQLSPTKKIVKNEFDNGFIWIYIQTPVGFEKMNFSHELIKKPNDIYQIDLASKKRDFNDYFDSQF